VPNALIAFADWLTPVTVNGIPATAVAVAPGDTSAEAAPGSVAFSGFVIPLVSVCEGWRARNLPAPTGTDFAVNPARGPDDPAGPAARADTAGNNDATNNTAIAVATTPTRRRHRASPFTK
jgi:hypothetical protein